MFYELWCFWVYKIELRHISCYSEVYHLMGKTDSSVTTAEMIRAMGTQKKEQLIQLETAK